ncbi:MAG: hypothetical protein HFG54_12560 [Lachnospiraceae bacterium]|jgi:hypothetical protein|nr:hypothetical protein [Lachnospiraceae bacterium]
MGMYELKKWQLSCRGEKVVGKGRCYGNPKFCEGCFIHTSAVVEAKLSEDRDRIFLTTRSGNQYVLFLGEMDEGAKEITWEGAKVLGLSLDRERCLSLLQQAQQERREYLEGILKPCEMYVKLNGALMTAEAYYRTEQGELLELEAGCHVGMFTDSVLVGGFGWNQKKCSCEWRYMICGSGISCYFWDGELDAVRIFNEGQDFIAEDSGRKILCKEKEITVLNRKERL